MVGISAGTNKFFLFVFFFVVYENRNGLDRIKIVSGVEDGFNGSSLARVQIPPKKESPLICVLGTQSH